MDVVVVNKVLEEDKVVEEVNKKLVKEYNDFFLNFSEVRYEKIDWRWSWLWWWPRWSTRS